MSNKWCDQRVTQTPTMCNLIMELKLLKVNMVIWQLY